MLESLILYLKGMRTIMFQLYGYYCRRFQTTLTPPWRASGRFLLTLGFCILGFFKGFRVYDLQVEYFFEIRVLGFRFLGL